MMFNRIKSSFLAVSILSVFFIATWVTITFSSSFAANPELMGADRYPAPILEENEVTESERVLEYLRWRHNAGPSDMDESERVLAYLRWKHNAVPIVENEVTESERVLEYLRWRHNAGPSDMDESERFLAYLRMEA